MTAVISFCGLSLLLLAGKILRVATPLLQKLYLPASVVGGTLGLLLLTFCGEWIPDGWTIGWEKLPGFLINVVFASLFLGSPLPTLQGMGAKIAPQVCFGQIVAWGQYTIGLGLTAILLLPLFGVPMLFGNLLEIGFEGGHGTVGGLTETFQKVGWQEGKDLGLAVATAGMVMGIVVGMALINWGIQRGYVSRIRTFDDQTLLEKRGFYPPAQQPPAGKQTVFSDSVDSLAIHVALIGLAISVGYVLQQGLLWGNVFLPVSAQKMRLLESFPLFPFCMIGGLLTQAFLQCSGIHLFVDHGQMQRIAGASLDFLVVSAIASMQLAFVATYWLPLTLLILTGTCWNVFCVLFFGPRLFREAWFERSLAEFGQSMGVTATGLLLLRTVDPDSETCAASMFGYKQLFHEPLMGGGLWTSLAVPLVVLLGGWWVWLICAVMLLFWLLIWGLVLRVKKGSQNGILEG